MGAKPQPCYNRICALNDRVITRLQCSSNIEHLLGPLLDVDPKKCSKLLKQE